MRPVRLAANQPPRFYRGGAAIADLRDAPSAVEFGPEDWVASTTTLFGMPEEGLSRLPDGRWLRDAVRADPTAWLGEEHVATHADDPALLVKLLDAGQRLPVHCHPSDAFARAHLGCRFGKTEAWVVVGTSGPDPLVHVGFREDVDAGTVRAWVSTQDTAAMLGALNAVRVRPGDTVFVPAGLPHAIGEGVFIVELQQPTDLSVMLEWRGFAEDESAGHLGLGYETALACVDTSGWSAERLAGLVRGTGDRRAPAVPLLPPEADEFFRADRLHPDPVVELEPSFAVLVVLEGAGVLRADSGDLAVRRGDTVVVPHGAGAARLEGDVVAVRCRPPAPGRK
ncbi:mannose-6-phosphate isomerase [Streptoalloteichus tenebrarius]|uniref:Mannose-6-phosphate isomerase n=1 Tax=Streptoalloteichus tenebrarius (strain ATCC 17920 / DSM 40477 / JCM 4838 / CBS 697.72 / NBRC 16177 / NCIMB 11028 / NRRL B-12390 / A12253. 1 / ISP 5477) TaxID=1933 RepID=A0ABT1HZQ4_STRSD|nr:class I mannose-6-phosphate isomerase [Streptoalloteichus tenebrarius]MCP2261018.1 mannose-6-phosphate isomerase [Streptoalloteichus tenebrarius]BFF03190.1 class I mannose-6-phosphate isomerase [Streptoalloteichus tenebrarius]